MNGIFNLQGVLFICLFFTISLSLSCKKDEKKCMSSDNSFIQINDEKYEIDTEGNEVLFKCEYNTDLNGYIIGFDEIIETVGGIKINDGLIVFIKINELKEGVYPLKHFEDYYCQTGDWAIIKDGEAFSSIQVNNCCSFMNEEAFIEVIKCNGTFIIKGENITFTEYSCEVEEGGSFTASFELICV